jgi:phospholipid/cholesterol/gamma-HCH transport system substrate-binding protein
MKRRDEVLVGIVATIALAVAVMGSIFLARGSLAPGYPMYAVFDWGAGLKQGQPVLLSGVSVGYVGEVGFRRDGSLLVTLRLKKGTRVPRSTTASVAPNGFFGDMMIALRTGGMTDEDFAIGDTIPSGPASISIDAVLARVDSIGADLQRITQTLNREFVEHEGLAEIRRTVVGANRLIRTLSEVATVQSAELTRTQESLRRIANAVDSAQVDSTVRALASASGNVNLLATDLRETTLRLNGVLGKLEGDSGSAGLLLNDAGMYRDVRGLLQRLDSLTTDFQRNPRKYIKLSIF